MRLCRWFLGWYKGGRFICGAPAKRCGRKAYCADHFPAVVACLGAVLLLSLGGGR